MPVGICGPVQHGQVRTSISESQQAPTHTVDLKLRLVLKMSIVGLVTKPAVTTQISDVACPFELPVTSV